MKQGNTSDTALVTALMDGEEGQSLEERAMELLPKIGRLLLHLHG